MQIIASPTERSTAATDAMLGLVALGYATELLSYRCDQPWKAGVWAATYAAIGASGSLGAVIHGFEMPAPRRAALWRVLDLLLGITVALFAAAAVGDLYGEQAARRSLPGLLLGAFGFYALKQRLKRGFLIFIIYAATAMLFALGGYIRLARAGQLAGAPQIAAAILISIIAAAIQSSNLKLSFLGIQLDHNGLYHLVQIAGLPLLAAGLRSALAAQAAP